MGTTQQARNLLKGQWLKAVAVECIYITAGLIVPLFYLFALRLLGLSVETVVHASDIPGGGWVYLLLTLAFLIADWLAVSPVLVGRISFYKKIASGERPPLRTIFKYLGKGYFHTVRWRFSSALRRFLDIIICLFPAVFAAGVSKAVRQSGSFTPEDDFLIMMGNIVGAFLLMAGLIVFAMISLRRMLAVYILVSNDGSNYPKKLFKTSASKMRGNITRMFQFNIGYIGWFASCLLVLPIVYVSPLFLTAKSLEAVKIINSESCEKQPAGKNKSPVPQDTLTLPNM